MQLGGLLEDLTVAKARAGIEKLVHLTPRTARVLSPAGEKVVPAEEVHLGALHGTVEIEKLPQPHQGEGDAVGGAVRGGHGGHAIGASVDDLQGEAGVPLAVGSSHCGSPPFSIARPSRAMMSW